MLASEIAKRSSCSRDMQVRRNIDAVVAQIRREISEACSKMADVATSRRSMKGRPGDTNGRGLLH